MRVAIIGAGLAGCALAYVLKQAGLEPVIYEQDHKIAPGASGNVIGLYNPRFAAEFGPEAQFYSAAFSKALTAFEALEDRIDWHPCGALHFMNDEKKEKRFAQTVQNWPSPVMQIVSAEEASAIAGVKVGYDCLYLPRSGSVCPAKLCEAYAHGIEVHLNAYVPSLDLIEADAVVVANGMGVLGFYPMMPLRGVRGQVTLVRPNEVSEKLKTHLCYGGYTSAPAHDLHVVGSTFQRWRTDSEVDTQDDLDNLEKLAAHVPEMAGFEIVGSRAAIRTTSHDHFPIVGRIEDGVYISTAHGSHGILSSLMAGYILKDMILGHTPEVSAEVLAALSPQRFGENIN